MKLLSILIFSAMLAGCASTPPMPLSPERALYDDAAFSKPADMITPAQIFALTPEMKAYAEKIRQRGQIAERHQALYRALYERDKLQLEYDSAMTRTASQAFEARTGNCLSLVIMTAAFARELGLDVKYQRLTSEDTWSRSGSLYFSSGHVNLVLGRDGEKVPTLFDRSRAVVIDFLPPPDAEMMPTVVISENRIVAMFMNNRAAETMVQGKLDDAYWWARAAIENDPAFMLGYNTLATVYQRHGDLAQADRTLRFAHQHEPLNTVILFNLSELSAAMGRTEDAARFKAELAALEPYPPFYFFNQGQQAMKDGDYQKARSMFVREVQRAPYYHEFHFWLAKAAFELGDLKEADKHMRLALMNSTTRSDSDIYAGKLANLRLYEARVRLRP
ncbi:tetratricopeptide repeat protein [Pseudoduganella eburnea]|uniref:Tetratricopeptide repeat protein n=1 Tax=Massilia eburnea TaxID=1776165 RepID=A0A6L6QQM6_9BURK|nr:tetratricopeptide repeat protein [Massilia eburnea]MTW14500.1 tetratricopeptide repeat protein [Massilia eburnea]